MNHPVLNQVLLGYAPLIDRQREVIATRLTVFPAQPEASVPVAELLAALAAALPEAGVRLALNVAHEGLLHALLRAQPAASVMIASARSGLSLSATQRRVITGRICATPSSVAFSSTQS